MNIQYLREFIQLAHSLNFRKAAQALYLSTSTLSKHIASMEDELGAELLTRDNKEVALTNAGRTFLNAAIGLVSDYDRVLEEIRGASAVQGDLKICGAVHIPRISEILHDAVRDFEAEYPDVNISIEDGRFEDYRAQLLSGEYDVVLSVSLPNGNNEGLELCELFELPLCIWVNDASRFNGDKLVTLRDFAHMKLRLLEGKESLYASYVKDIFAKRGIRIRMGKRMNRAFAIADDEFVITPRFMPAGYLGYGLEIVDLSEDISVQFAAVKKYRTCNLATTLFFDELKGRLLAQKEAVLDGTAPRP